MFLSFLVSDHCVRMSNALFLLSLSIAPGNGAMFLLHEKMATASAALIVAYCILSIRDFICHWRILPFLIAFLLHVFTERQYRDNSAGTMAPVVLTAVSVLLSCVTLLLLYLFPIFPPAKLLGWHRNVGTLSFTIIVDGQGDIPVQCWFPSSSSRNASLAACLWTSGCPREQTRESVALLSKIASMNNLPSFVLRHLLLMKTNSVFTTNPTLPESITYPVAIYSHGLYGWRQTHHTACEKLASSGYIVFAMDHVPDSTLARPFELLRESRPFNFKPPVGCSIAEDRAFHAKGIERRHSQIMELVRHVKNDSFVFKDSLDMGRLVLFGHSYGGATVASIGCLEKIAKAIVVLDGWMYPLSDETRLKGSSAPILFLSAQSWPSGPYQSPFREDLVARSMGVPAVDIILEGSNHQNFCDSHLICNPRLMKGGAFLGDADAKDLNDIIDAAIIGFFNHCLEIDATYNNCSDATSSVTAVSSNISLEYLCAKYYLSPSTVHTKSISSRKVRHVLNLAKKIARSRIDLPGCFDDKFFPFSKVIAGKE